MEDIDLKAEIGQKIRSIRGKTKQKDFAKLIGIHKNQLNRYETGKSLPRPDTYKKIFRFSQTSTTIYSDASHLKEGLVKDREVAYEIFRVEQKELIGNVQEILESGNDVMIDALKANIKAFLEAVRNKKKDENK